MHILFTILKILGIILLILLCLVLVIGCLVLFVPIRYNAQGRFEDPEGHAEILPDRPKERAFGEAHVTWLFKAVHVAVQYPGEELIRATAFGIKLPVDKFLHREKPEQPEEEKEEEKKEEKKNIWQILEELPDKIDDLIYRKDYYMKVLSGSCGKDALGRVKKELLTILASVLPAEWALGGNIGLGTPIRSANVMEVAGFTYPVTAGHLFITPNWYEYQYDLTAAFDGKITLAVIVFAALRLLLSKNVRRFIKKLRKGPPPRHKEAEAGKKDTKQAA